jgi:hypothetical protein
LFFGIVFRASFLFSSLPRQRFLGSHNEIPVFLAFKLFCGRSRFYVNPTSCRFLKSSVEAVEQIERKISAQERIRASRYILKE